MPAAGHQHVVLEDRRVRLVALPGAAVRGRRGPVAVAVTVPASRLRSRSRPRRRGCGCCRCRRRRRGSPLPGRWLLALVAAALVVAVLVAAVAVLARSWLPLAVLARGSGRRGPGRRGCRSRSLVAVLVAPVVAALVVAVAVAALVVAGCGPSRSAAALAVVAVLGLLRRPGRPASVGRCSVPRSRALRVGLGRLLGLAELRWPAGVFAGSSRASRPVARLAARRPGRP